jgi:hypothetical protein
MNGGRGGTSQAASVQVYGIGGEVYSKGVGKKKNIPRDFLTKIGQWSIGSSWKEKTWPNGGSSMG